MAIDDDTLEFHSSQEKFRKFRYLTVLETVLESHTRIRSVGLTYLPIELEPCIVLHGEWLADAGFNTGDQVTVRVSEKHLVVNKETNALGTIPPNGE